MEQGRRLFGLCSTYIDIDGNNWHEEEAILLKEIEDAYSKWEFDNRALFEEIADNLEEPMDEQKRERYCSSLITPFGDYSRTIYPKWPTDERPKRIAWLQDRAEKYRILAFGIVKDVNDGDKTVRKVFGLGEPKDVSDRNLKVKHYIFEFAQIVYEYGILLDAAFVMHGVDLKRLQDRWSLWIKQNDWQHELRVVDIGYYVGSEALAEEYLNRLPQEQPEPQQEQGNYQREQQPETQQAATPEDTQEPQQIPTIHNTEKEKLVFGKAISKEYMELNNGCYKWKKSIRLLAYMCGRLYCGDKVKVDESDYSEELIKGKSQLPRAELKKLFGVDVGNNRDQLKAPPRQYHIIDGFFKR